jgi:ABC-type phosphate/phosphonate transport system permease subunit
MVTRLSSLQTFFCKFIFPPILIGGFGLAVTKTRNTADPKSWLAILMIWIVCSAFLYWSCVRLKKVSIDDQFLYVSNYLKEIAIPFSLIGDVTENTWLNTPVTIHFKLPTEFGDEIVFMPKFRWVPSLSSHPVVAMLRQLAGIS